MAPLFQIGFDVLPGDSPIGFNFDVKHIVHTGNDKFDFDSITVGIGLVARF